ncbi:hypothetical protein M408DRAFT_194049 [Serendipita vermifera MAFF 305830]|uniref:Uncharacterized protein n=1 Tax=Serendipita vermifera MAFF 305830 TaxID=933852 RepID=A0A0C3A4E9_SERVB|nr:hypothetical protein M408DRAFT_205111 [Serendipita vermifera MAFF 305830]KIM19661.1 hypothetical protein M408DRAFT_194049 [Serendipita vermifera MAFF 305830]
MSQTMILAAMCRISGTPLHPYGAVSHRPQSTSISSCSAPLPPVSRFWSCMEVIDDGNTSRIDYQGDWAVTNATGAGGGTVHSSRDPDGVISFTFVGSSVQIDAQKSPDGANFTVVLDGSTYGPYSLYAPTPTIVNVWSQTQLSPTATHTLSVQKAKQSSGPDSVLELNIDAFRSVPCFDVDALLTENLTESPPPPPARHHLPPPVPLAQHPRRAPGFRVPVRQACPTILHRFRPLFHHPQLRLHPFHPLRVVKALP